MLSLLKMAIVTVGENKLGLGTNLLWATIYEPSGADGRRRNCEPTKAVCVSR